MPGYYKKASALPKAAILEDLSNAIPANSAIQTCPILLSSEGRSMTEVTEQLRIHRGTVSTWRKRWLRHQEHLTLIEVEADRQALSEAILSTLSDAPRSGTPVRHNFGLKTPTHVGISSLKLREELAHSVGRAFLKEATTITPKIQF